MAANSAAGLEDLNEEITQCFAVNIGVPGAFCSKVRHSYSFHSWCMAQHFERPGRQRLQTLWASPPIPLALPYL
jgi:hypothetical protein